MRAQQLISHAARALDLSGDVPKAESELRRAIAAAQDEQDTIGQIQASAFLGELLVSTGREEDAAYLFESVLEFVRNGTIEPDMVEHEVRIAREYLAKRAGLE